jgi:uncharacterized protein with ParB-like and HNH nuclease domain
MKVDKLTIGRIFDSTERLEAPLFQRPYVWEEERNWTPLWESIQTIAEKVAAKQVTRPHFLGALVLDQLKTNTGRVHARQIIDGQQRLTTLQLALAAARDLCQAEGLDKYCQAFKRLTDNDVPLSEDPDEIFKVWPTNADQALFRNVMSSKSASTINALIKQSKDDDCLIPHCYVFFSETFQQWLHSGGATDVTARLDALYRTIRDELHLVAIDLERDDDAQEIFETLNALGTPLLPADLVKNFLFRLAEARQENTVKLYEQYWSAFDDDKAYWRKEIKQGRLKRPRVDLFLQHYLTLRTGQDVNATQLFSNFRDYVISNDGQTIAKQMATFRAYSDIYRKFEEFPEGSRENVFFYRLDQLETTTVFPVLLEVFKRYAGLECQDEREQIMTDLESYFVRRTVCELTTKSYNRVFADMIRAIEKDGFSSSAIRSYLVEKTEDANRWPTNAEFSKAWCPLPFYRKLRKSRTRLILEAIDSAMQTPKTEPIPTPRGLTIEHLIPREWEKNWPLLVDASPTASPERAAETREELIDSIGNLTLLTKSLNPAVSNGAWTRKRQEILKHSALSLNRDLPETWDEEKVQSRTQKLLSVAIALWPHPVKEGANRTTSAGT